MIKEIVMCLEIVNTELNILAQEEKEKQANLQAQLIAENEEAAYWNHIANMQHDDDSTGPWYWELK